MRPRTVPLDTVLKSGGFAIAKDCTRFSLRVLRSLRSKMGRDSAEGIRALNP